MIKHTYEALKTRFGKKKTDFILFIIGVALLFGFANAVGIIGTNEMDGQYGGAMPMVGERSVGVATAPMFAREDYAYDAVTASSEYKSGMIAPVPINQSNNVISADRKIIKNGSLELRVEDAEKTVDAVEAVATKYKGFVDASNIYEVSDNIKAGGITIRVPNDSFLQAMDDIKLLALKVEQENVNASDVTAQVVDYEAQIKNLRVEEEQYRALMNRAGKIEEILQVTARLSDVRGRIDQIQTQLNYLSRQVAMSTISISLTAEPEVKILGIVWRPLTVIKQALHRALYDITSFVDEVIYFVAGLPGLILRIVGIAFIIWVLWRAGSWIKRKFFPLPNQSLNS